MNTTADKLNRLTETKNAIKTAITAKGGAVNDAMTFREYANAIMGIPQEGGGGGSGIIDVTELPTENIDENAVYRVTESYKSENANVWIVAPDEATGELVVVRAEDAHGECEIYVVDTTEDMVVTDPNSGIVNLNILRSDGIAYLVAPELGGTPLPLGLVAFSVEGLDKGYTQDPYLETEIGIYTTLEQYDTFKRMFIRENGEWKEITAYIYATSPLGITTVNMLTGDISSRVFAINNLLSGEVEEIDEGWFITPNGKYTDYIQAYAFSSSKLKTATIPYFIEAINQWAFAYCNELTTVTFKGTPRYLDRESFDGSTNLATINVPWSEGEVENAPWGATNATINYNYTEG